MKISVQMNNLRNEFKGGKCPLITSNHFHNNTIYIRVIAGQAF